MTKGMDELKRKNIEFPQFERKIAVREEFKSQVKPLNIQHLLVYLGQDILSEEWFTLVSDSALVSSVY